MFCRKQDITLRKTILGSKAVYEKQVDSSGKTIQTTKTTYAPDGTIVHVKDKMPGEEFRL